MSLLIWFRNDLRLDDHQALQATLRRCKNEDLKCRALYIRTPAQWQEHDLSSLKLALVQAQLDYLYVALNKLGIDLDIIDGSDFAAVPQQLAQYCQAFQISDIYASVEPEINEIRRDRSITDLGLTLHLLQGHCLLPSGSVLNQQGQMFKRFTPYKRVWLTQVKLDSWGCLKVFNQPEPISPARKPARQALELSAASKIDERIENWPIGDQQILEHAAHFIQSSCSHYHLERDIPSLDSTSKLSAYLAIGAISPRRLLQLLLVEDPLLFETQNEGLQAWLNELIWREFYRHLIVANPSLCMGHNFIARGDAIVWRNSPELFQAWCEGRTGYPLVDAAMRQLTSTGWMHNRLRMVVASFLTKHLLIDWRHGERFFMQQLIDGDLAANNGGWQWAASTGCDAQPYFRIFNPIRQSERFDPKGLFIRKWVKELKDFDGKSIHFPNQGLGFNNYPAAIVEHAQARALALDVFSVVSAKN